MSEVTKITEKYIEITKKDMEEHAKSAKEANDYILHSTAKYHGRCVKALYVPKIYTGAEKALFQQLVATICGIFYKVMERYEEDESYRKLFGFEPRLEELILRKPLYQVPIPIARIDIFLDEQTGDFKFCEFNTDGTSAMNEDRELNIAIQKTKAYQELAKEYEFESMELFDSWVETFLEIYHQCKDAKEYPNVVIADFMENATEMEFQIFAKHFKEHGCKTQICEIRDLKYRNGHLYTPEGMEIDAIYRRAVTSDIMKHYEEVGDFLEAVKNNAVCLIGDFKTQIAHNKILYKILHLPQTKEFLSDAENAFVEAHVPKTYSIHDERLKTEDILADKNQWILKPEDSYGSQGIHAGVECGDKEWKEYVLKEREDVNSTYLIQEFCMPYQSLNIDLTKENPEFFPVYNLTGLFTYGGRFKGVYSRISQSEIISTQYSEMALPTLFVKER